MSNKEVLLKKLTGKPTPRNFTMRELDQLMAKCDCEKGFGGRGSSIRYEHLPTHSILTFDQPHPSNVLQLYQVKKVIGFLNKIGEIKGGSR